MSDQPINLRYIKQEWNGEIPSLLRGWWVRHWWPARAKQLERERNDWKRWLAESEERAGGMYHIDWAALSDEGHLMGAVQDALVSGFIVGENQHE